MAISLDKKKAVTADLEALLQNSKLTVMAKYTGTPVKSMQDLRRLARSDGTQIRIVKNRLFKRALGSIDVFKNIDTGDIKGQLMYAFNPVDDVAPAKNLADFAKQSPNVSFVAGLTKDGRLLSADDLKSLAALPGKDQLRGSLLGTLSAPTSQFASVLAANLRGIINVLNARSESAN